MTTTVKDAAIQIQNSSFAIYRVNETTKTVIRDAWGEATKILNVPPSPIDSDSKTWTRIVGGHLYGYNEPSRAKRLFRAFPASNLQPWPKEAFRRLSCTLAQHIHGILMDCYASLVLRDNCTENENRDRKRIKREGDALRASKSNGCPFHYVDITACPLDYFLYHNLDPTANNCTEHVDRGLLIAVCLTDVPGLEILMPQGQDCEERWYCPEIAIHNSKLYTEMPDSSVSDLVCIMAGGQLTQISKGEIQGCVHRVRNHLKRARLSISYELRLPQTLGPWM